MRVADGAFTRSVGKTGSGKLEFQWPLDISIAADECVFIADGYNNRVQVLTPKLEFKAFVGVGQLKLPYSVCADDSRIVVGDRSSISVFSQRDYVCQRRVPNESFGCHVRHSVRLVRCVTGGRHLVVLDYSYRLFLITINGDFVRCLVTRCQDVACSEFGEIVAICANANNVDFMNVYWADGTLLRSFPIANSPTNVTLANSRVFLTSDVAESVMME